MFLKDRFEFLSFALKIATFSQIISQLIDRIRIVYSEVIKSLKERTLLNFVLILVNQLTTSKNCIFEFAVTILPG